MRVESPKARKPGPRLDLPGRGQLDSTLRRACHRATATVGTRRVNCPPAYRPKPDFSSLMLVALKASAAAK